MSERHIRCFHTPIKWCFIDREVIMRLCPWLQMPELCVRRWEGPWWQQGRSASSDLLQTGEPAPATDSAAAAEGPSSSFSPGLLIFSTPRADASPRTHAVTPASANVRQCRGERANWRRWWSWLGHQLRGWPGAWEPISEGSGKHACCSLDQPSQPPPLASEGSNNTSSDALVLRRSDTSSTHSGLGSVPSVSI